MSGRERGHDMPPEAGREAVPGPEAGRGEDEPSDVGRRVEASDRLMHAEAVNEVREAKDRIADALWARPAAFAEYAAAQGPDGNLARFLEAFAALDDGALRTETLKRAREAAARAAGEGGAA